MAKVQKRPTGWFEIKVNVGPEPFTKGWERTFIIESSEARALLPALLKAVLEDDSR